MLRTGSIEIGAHTLAENKISIGDTTADKLQQFGVASTTLGTNSYTGGGFATTIGSIMCRVIRMRLMVFGIH